MIGVAEIADSVSTVASAARHVVIGQMDNGQIAKRCK
jgi:hypothetical protein